MITTQDQQVMQDYLSDMLFQSLAKDLESFVETPLEEIPVKEKGKEKTKASIEVKKEISEAIEVNIGNHQAHLNEEAIAEDTSNELENTVHNPFTNYCWKNRRPPWAQSRFDCLLFEVRNFKFAVPLITLGQIHGINEDLRPVFGQAQWFMGLQQTELGKQRVINTALYVMPERCTYDADYKPPYMLTIAECPWALAVDKVHQPVSLEPEEVKWRVGENDRDWRAGIVKKQMCLLIDIPALANSLMSIETEKTA